MLVYFWLRSSKDAASQGPTLGTQLAESIKKYIDTPLPLTYETSAKKYRNKHKTKNNISEDTHTEFTLDTTGCQIPLNRVNYMQYSKSENNYKEKFTCGKRAVYLKKTDVNTVNVFIDRKKIPNGCTNFHCLYQFFNETTRPDEKLRYGRKLYDNMNITLESDFIDVVCRCGNQNYNYDVYNDLFAFIKENITQPKRRTKNSCKYNVLMLGMDSMSLARLEQTMPKTFSFLNKNSAISFQGYHKVGDNTFPNLMAALSGYDERTIKEHCRKSMRECHIIWKMFKRIGYTTAYGEDFLRLPETFGGHFTFDRSPTDHHIKPLFIRNEKEVNKTIICTGKAFAGQQLLEYAKDFVTTYQHGPFFGVFWINSFSHNENSRPQDADRLLESFFDNVINKMNILSNTFIIFLSDQGLRFGKHRMNVESYYEERLPFLFILPPRNFIKTHPLKWTSLNENQRKLITPYDLYNTLHHIYNLSRCMDDSMKVSYACRNCRSLLTKISTKRTCEDVNIDEKWCSCHQLTLLNQKNYLEGMNSVIYAVSEVQKKIQNIKTIPGFICAHINLNQVIRIHYYYDVNKRRPYFVVAFTTTPGNVSFEAIVSMRKIVSLSVISPYRGSETCALDTSIRSRLYCYCEKNCSA